MVSGQPKASAKRHRSRLRKILHLLSGSGGAAPGRRLREKIDCNLSPLDFVPSADPETVLLVSGERQRGTGQSRVDF
jgi:hypothetical protein